MAVPIDWGVAVVADEIWPWNEGFVVVWEHSSIVRHFLRFTRVKTKGCVMAIDYWQVGKENKETASYLVFLKSLSTCPKQICTPCPKESNSAFSLLKLSTLAHIAGEYRQNNIPALNPNLSFLEPYHAESIAVSRSVGETRRLEETPCILQPRNVLWLIPRLWDSCRRIHSICRCGQILFVCADRRSKTSLGCRW